MSKVFEWKAGSFIDQVSKEVGTATDVEFRRTEKGTAGLFDGSSSQIAITQTTYDIDGSTVSFEFWFKAKDETTDSPILGNSSNNGYSRILYNPSSDRFILESNINDDIVSITLNTKNTNWHHYLIICNNGTVTAYQDNVSMSVFSSMDNDITLDLIGAEPARNCLGYIGKISIYDHALSTQERNDLNEQFLQASPTEKPVRGFEYPKPTDLSHERNTDFTGDEYIQVMEFTDNSGTTSNLRLNDGGDFAVVDWTGNSDFQEISTSTETDSNVTPSTVRIFAKNGELTYFRSTDNEYSFDIADLPSGLTYYSNYGNNTTFGDIADLPSGLTYYNNTGNNQVDTYTAGRTWDSGVYYIEHKPAAGYGLSSTEVDNLLIDLDNSGMSSGTIDLSGNNAVRTSASDAAVTSLQGKGVSVSVNT